MAELLWAVSAVGRAPHPFYSSEAEHVWVCPDVILPGGCSLLWAPCPEEYTVSSPRGILQVFGLASFTPVHDKWVSRWAQPGASQHCTGLCPLSTKLKVCATQAAYLEKLFQTPGLQPVRWEIQRATWTKASCVYPCTNSIWCIGLISPFSLNYKRWENALVTVKSCFANVLLFIFHCHLLKSKCLGAS